MNQNDKTIIWKVIIISPVDFVPEIEKLITITSGDYSSSISAFEIKDNLEKVLVEIYFDYKPDIDILNTKISKIASSFGIKSPQLKLEKLEDIDWVAASQKILKPIQAGMFYLYGQHDITSIPTDKISIQMEAAQAFGTGSHETTKGCLLAISDLHTKLDPKNTLDLGCGSGVLAIAMAKIWNCNVVASDIDPIATDTTKENIILNGTNDILVVTSDGFNNSTVCKTGPYDLIVANILSGPLILLAPSIVNQLEKGGFLILSGLLRKQQDVVIETYISHGMVIEKKYPIHEWQTLVFKKSSH